MKNSTDDLYTQDGKADRIIIFQHAIYPSDRDVLHDRGYDDSTLEKMGVILEDHYKEFVDFCDYLSDNGKKIVDVSSYVTPENEIVFEVYDGKSTSTLSFRKKEEVCDG